ncbi:FtsK/SpoIIIE domain-containing protein [Cnuibacter sp. UC19_7]|uniref:FtsK/SpoIIIE domain-containing protein n=1 Tax=Cnuibacter sp. UC19_7 TaxID=3350166 RepID=UPI003670AAFF
MRLRVALRRHRGPDADIVVTTDATATIGDIAAAIAESDPVERWDPQRVTLSVSPPAFADESILSRTTPLADAEIGSGFGVRIVGADQPVVASRQPAAIARILSGPDAGREIELPLGESTVGRDPGCTVVLHDPLASKVHAKIIVGESIEIADLNSANGLLIDGGVVTRVTVGERQTVTVGGTELGFRRLGTVDAGRTTERGGALPFNRSPRVEPRYPGREFNAPRPPEDQPPTRFPWVSLAAPIVTGVAMYAVLQSPFALLFVALAPVLALGSFLDGGMGRRSRRRRDVERFDAELHDLSVALAAEAEPERRIRGTEAPSTTEVYADAMQRGPLLWTRRPEHWSFLSLRLGLAALPTRNTITTSDEQRALPELRGRVESVVAPFRSIADVPVVDSAYDSGALGVAGPRSAAADAARALLVQVVGLHSPAEVAVAALTSAAWSPELGWLGWLPHVSSPHSPLGETVHLADSAATGTALLAALEELVETRTAPRADRGPTTDGETVQAAGARVGEVRREATVHGGRRPALVLLVTDDAPVDRARLVQMAERAAGADVHVIWVAADRLALPAVCRCVLALGPDGAEVDLVRLGRTVTEVRTERIDVPQAVALARRMAPLVDSGATVDDSSDLPATVSFLTLVGHELAETPSAVIDRWRQSGTLRAEPDDSAAGRARRSGGLRALVGVSGADAMHLDLRGQGPHALVGGTTGSGKSEFLQTWVLGMAVESSPLRTTFLFVDYKGGSAFAECVALPHSVGLVTDLSPHLVRRALTSLRAELQHRERLLGAKKAKDVLELERRGDPDCPPALVIVIDEFAALATDVPEFVDGVVDVAQRGRSLGIHLVMATQRPAGVIRDNLRANTNLRVALRMADEHDSTDVVGDKSAAQFDPGIPGRAVAKTGPGRLTGFQTAYVGGRTSREPERAEVKVAELRFGAEVVWEPVGRGDVPVDDGRASDLARIVASVGRAAVESGLPAPRRPWLDELASTYDVAALPAVDQGWALGIADLPERQAQTTAMFSPDVDGHLAIVGTSGSGKTVALRTLAVVASSQPEPVEVHGLDFAGGGLRMLERLPTVGSMVPGDDDERVARLIRMLAAELDDRNRSFSARDAATIGDYRAATGEPLPRILLLIDGFPLLRTEWDTAPGRAARYADLMRILGDGRRVGLHVAFTADRPGAIPSAVNAVVPRRVVLRMSDDNGYLLLDVPGDVLDATSPPGRAVLDGHETQIAVPGGERGSAAQAAAVDALAAALRTRGVPEVPPVRSLPAEIPAESLPDSVGGAPVLGVSDETLEPVAFDPRGALALIGPPASGRSTALLWLAQSLRRWQPDIALYRIGPRRSPLATAVAWTENADDPESIVDLARRLAVSVAEERGPGEIAILVESVADLLSTPADGPTVELIRAVKRSDQLLIAEAETSSWVSSWPLLAEIKNSRRGILLQPDPAEGDSFLRTTLPRVPRSDFPPGRGYLVAGAPLRVQLPLPAAASYPVAVAAAVL